VWLTRVLRILRASSRFATPFRDGLLLLKHHSLRASERQWGASPYIQFRALKMPSDVRTRVSDRVKVCSPCPRRFDLVDSPVPGTCRDPAHLSLVCVAKQARASELIARGDGGETAILLKPLRDLQISKFCRRF
jgi:hypothetical protein